ncbi:hypothetical protein MLD38_016190 [Melastoma candidum]|uniref:Uncharacterized protein n=1 Tax=Melastoma candidum TaxID=119954 RepID=A0ACB9RMA3_9MYRT|nr:hypothetical protein MLD38_016190 [Melastoma candidum]
MSRTYTSNFIFWAIIWRYVYTSQGKEHFAHDLPNTLKDDTFLDCMEDDPKMMKNLRLLLSIVREFSLWSELTRKEMLSPLQITLPVGLVCVPDSLLQRHSFAIYQHSSQHRWWMPRLPLK